MTKATINPIEAAQNLALAVGYIKKELKKRDKRLAEQFSSALEARLAPLQQQLSTIQPAQYVLPESVAHDSNLQALRDSLEFMIEIKDKLHSKSIEATLREIEKGKFETFEHVSATKTSLEQVDSENKTKIDEASTKLAELHQLHETNTAILTASINQVDHARRVLEDNVKQAKTDLNEAIQQAAGKAASQLVNTKTHLTKAIGLVTELIDAHADNSNKALQSLTDSIASQFSTITSSVDGRFDDFARSLQTSITQTSMETDRQLKVFGKKTTADFKAADKKILAAEKKARKTLVSALTIVQREIAKLKLGIADVSGDVAKAEARLAEAITDLDERKLNAKDALTKKDLKSIKESIINAIPMPKDGKDGHEWLFRPHPTKRGVMLYKREDWKEWKEVVLAVNPPQDYGGGGPGVGSQTGGSGGTATGLSVVVDGTTKSTRMLVQNVTTDSSGYFVWTFGGSLGVSEVYWAEARSAMISGSVPFNEKFTEAFITNVTPTQIEGYVMRQRRRTNLTGMRDVYSMVPAPAGVQVSIMTMTN